MNAADVIEFCKKNNVDIRIRFESQLYEYQVRVERGNLYCVCPISGAEMDLALPETKNAIAERAFEEIAIWLRCNGGRQLAGGSNTGSLWSIARE